MIFWYTLAESKIGTHKMKLKEPMTKEKAEMVGRSYCLENNLKYIGTYDSRGINDAETEFRLDNY